MTILLGGLALLVLWWGAGRARRLHPSLTKRLMRQVGGYVALALAGLVLVRGRFEIAILLAGAALWLFEGTGGLARRWHRLTAGRRVAGPPPGARILWIDRTGEPFAQAGPFAGQRLAGLPLGVLRDLLAFGRANDPEGARWLETYLDRRHPGWRVDADADADPRPRGAPHPGAMTQDEAYQVLGLQSGASLEEIRTAHRTLMKRLHPDQGGTVEQAARVNAARDRLMNRHR